MILTKAFVVLATTFVTDAGTDFPVGLRGCISAEVALAATDAAFPDTTVALSAVNAVRPSATAPTEPMTLAIATNVVDWKNVSPELSLCNESVVFVVLGACTHTTKKGSQ
jgi:hypothetical protein